MTGRCRRIPVAARVLSLPAAGQPELNRLRLLSGRWPDPLRRDEAILHIAFASAWNVRPGEAVTVILNGRRETFRIVGIGQSPDFVLASRSGTPLPDDRGFAVLWASEEMVSRAFDMEGAFNQFVVALAPGASEAAVILALDRTLAPYGGLGAYARRDHPSHRFLEDELSQQRTTAVIMPVLFFVIAAFLLSVVLGRLVEAQREQIAALKALGYPAWPIALHYAKFVAALCALGSAIGVAGGAWMGVGMLATYRPFLRFPELRFVLPVWLPLLGVTASFAAAFLGVAAALRRILRLSAAEGLRSAAPAELRGWSPRRLDRGLAPRHKMALRGLLGRPLRTGLTVLGLAFAVPMVVLGLFWRDALGNMMDVQFDNILRADAIVSFTDPRASRAIRELAGLPGVLAAEGQRVVAARISTPHGHYRVGLTGIADTAELSAPRDASLRRIAIPPEGLALSRRLAKRLRVKAGDAVWVEVMEGSRPTFQLPVAALVEDVIGMNAYVQIDALNRLMGEDDLVSQAALLVDPKAALDVWRRLDQRPGVTAVGVKSAWLRAFHEAVGNLVAHQRGLPNRLRPDHRDWHCLQQRPGNVP